MEPAQVRVAGDPDPQEAVQFEQAGVDEMEEARWIDG